MSNDMLYLGYVGGLLVGFLLGFCAATIWLSIERRKEKA